MSKENYTIAVIGEMVGYPDGSNYSAAFKKKFGINPEDFRNDEKRRLSQIKSK